MDSDDETKQLLLEIREGQKKFFDAWQQAYQDSLEKQARADQFVRRTRRTGWLWPAVCVLLILAIAYGLPSMLASRLCGRSRARGQSHLAQMRHFEALTWLERNPNESALASNRFGATAKALDFVKMLYERGAVGVYVANVRDDPARIEAEKGPYADVLIVALPQDKEERAALFSIHASEAAGQRASKEADHGQNELFFWWD